MSRSRKLAYTLIGLLILIVLSYQLGIKRTFRLHADNLALCQKLLMGGISEDELSYRVLENEMLRQRIGFTKKESSEIQNSWLVIVSGIASRANCKLESVNDYIRFEEHGSRFTIISCEVEGEYADILTFVNSLEQEFESAKLISIDLKVHENIRSRNRKLYATVYAQAISA